LGSVGYQVNALGQRYIKTVAASVTAYLYAASGKIIAETSDGGATYTEYVWLMDTPVAVIQSGNSVNYIHPDHLDTPRLIANQAGQTVWRWDNDDPFGGNVPNQNPSGLGTFAFNLRFPGQYFDSETNIHYNYYRDYSPEIGRYVQSDPIGLAGGINTYSYVDSDPLAYMDPAGLAKIPSRRPKALPYPQPPVPYPWIKPKPSEGEEAVPGSRERPGSSQQNSRKEQCYKDCEDKWDRGHQFCKLMSKMYADGYAYKACIAPYNEELRECLKECDETCK
jgi:RHS repeat-associated protein